MRIERLPIISPPNGGQTGLVQRQRKAAGCKSGEFDRHLFKYPLVDFVPNIFAIESKSAPTKPANGIVAVVNEEGLCGFDDWRMPPKDEIFSISDIRKAKSPPTIDIEYFPHAQAAEYWTANDYSFQPGSAWVWSFQHGHDRVDWKKSPKFVRLVRGVAIDLPAVKE